MITKKDQETINKILATGQLGSMKISVINEPRILVELGGVHHILNGNNGLREGCDGGADSILNLVRAQLQHSDLAEGFPFIGADKASSQTEHRTLHIPLHEFDKQIYEGELVAPKLFAHIEKSLGADASAEQLVGLAPEVKSRLVFNLVGSVADNSKPKFNRKVEGKLCTVFFNTDSGKWMAIRKEKEWREQAAPLAHLKINELDNASIVKALNSAPVIEKYLP